MTLSTSLATLQRGYRAMVDKVVAPLGLSHAQGAPLVMVGRHGDGLRPGVLAALLGIEGPSLVRSLAQLVDAGLLEFRDDAVDGRAKTVFMTPAGAAVRERVEVALRELRDRLYDGVPDADIDACLRVFGVLEPRLGRKSVAAAPLAMPVDLDRP